MTQESYHNFENLSHCLRFIEKNSDHQLRYATRREGGNLETQRQLNSLINNMSYIDVKEAMKNNQ